MTDDKTKLLQIISSLESDYRAGKISAEKYSYFRSKYEDKLNEIDAMEATKRIRLFNCLGARKHRWSKKQPYKYGYLYF